MHLTFLIKNGVVSDFLNNIRTQKIIGGTPGDVNIINMQNNFDLGITNIDFELSNDYDNDYDIFINEVDSQQTLFDLRTGSLSLFCYGYMKHNPQKVNKYNTVIDIIELVNKLKPASKKFKSGYFSGMDVTINI